MSSKFSNELAAAIASHAALPAFEIERSLDDSYRLQHEVTRARTRGAVGGVKAGGIFEVGFEGCPRSLSYETDTDAMTVTLNWTPADPSFAATGIKVLRDGKVSFADAHVRFKDGEAWLFELHIPEYPNGSWTNHLPTRPRKLLLHRKEIGTLIGAVTPE